MKAEQKKETYLEMMARHEKQRNNFPFMFAFNKEQFKEGMEKLGLQPSDTDKLYKLGGGGFIRKTDSEALDLMLKQQEADMDEGLKDHGFAVKMFDYELSNHEYSYTGETGDTLDALGFSYEEIENNATLKKALRDAIEMQRERGRE